MFSTIIYYTFFFHRAPCIVIFLSHAFAKAKMCRRREPKSAHNIYIVNVSFGAYKKEEHFRKYETRINRQPTKFPIFKPRDFCESFTQALKEFC